LKDESKAIMAKDLSLLKAMYMMIRRLGRRRGKSLWLKRTNWLLGNSGVWILRRSLKKR